MIIEKLIASFFITSLLLLLTQAHAKQEPDFSSQPIMLYTPFPGFNDAMARTISEKASKELEQPIVVQNTPGAAGAVAATKVLSAPATGHTLLYGSNGMFTIADLFNPDLTYDPSDFEPITMAYSQALVLLVNPELPVHSVAELIEYAKKNPGKITYGSSGVGTITHMAAEVLASLSDTDMTHIPYKGSAQALTDLIGGRISMLFFPSQDTVQHVSSGKVRALAVSTKERSRALPNLSTIAESGFPDYDVKVWYGFFAPASVPKEVISYLHSVLAKGVRETNLAQFDLLTVANTPSQFRHDIERDRATLRTIFADTIASHNQAVEASPK